MTRAARRLRTEKEGWRARLREMTGAARRGSSEPLTIPGVVSVYHALSY